MVSEELLSQRFSEIHQDLTAGIDKMAAEVSNFERKLDEKIFVLKEEIVREICQELKGKVLKTWKEGTERFYNEAAKSIVSEYSRSPSAASDYSRSRSASRDFAHAKKPISPIADYESLSEADYSSMQKPSPKIQAVSREGGISPME